MKLFDSHCHFDFDAFDIDRETVWQACKKIGIKKLLIPGTEPLQWQRAERLCAQFTRMFYSVGIHPYQYKSFKVLQLSSQDWQYHLLKSNCIAVGETGLDKRLSIPLKEQIEFLKLHIKIAQKFNKPIILHCVHAHNELIRTLKKSAPLSGVVHGFSGSYEVAKEYIDLGFMIGVGGTITYERAKKTRSAVSKLPINAIILETDAPDMPISGKQGMRNSPETLITIAETAAYLLNTSTEIIAEQTYLNTKKLFRLE